MDSSSLQLGLMSGFPITHRRWNSPGGGGKTFCADWIMRRLYLGLAAVAALAACTDSTPTGTRARGPDLRTRSTVSIADAQDDLNTEIRNIITCWPKGQENDLNNKWDDIIKKYNEAIAKPKKQKEVLKKLAETSKHVLKETKKIDVDPCYGMTPEEAASKLVLDMVLWVTGGDPDGENASGILHPDEPLTLVTSPGGAGVHFDAFSTKEDRIIVISENLTNYGYCDGPLLTELCQYPLYFDIQSFPDGALLLVAQAAVCHPAVDEFAGWPHPTSQIHGQLRLAHTKPDKPADYTPGGSIRSSPQENIEILPSITQTFLFCTGVEYPPSLGDEEVGVLQRGVHLASAVASRIVKLLTPKSAYAADQGGGGGFLDFSPFNNVDVCTSDNPEIGFDGVDCEAPTGPTGFTGGGD
jgi:hypothetical protein